MTRFPKCRRLRWLAAWLTWWSVVGAPERATARADRLIEGGRIYTPLRATAEWQRAWEIHQTQLCFVHFPNMIRRSRAGHMRQTGRVAARVLTSLARRGVALEPCVVDGFLAYGLSHDLGHFPESHLFEQLGRQLSTPTCHEEMLLRLAQGVGEGRKDSFHRFLQETP